MTARVTWPRSGIDPTGDADADRGEVLAPQGGAAERLVEARSDGRDGAALVTHGGGVGGTTEDGAVGVDDEGCDLRAADIDTGDRAGRIRWPLRRRSSMHREPELAREEQRAGAEERDVLAGAAVLDDGLLAGRGQAAGRGLVTDGVEPRVAERRHGPDKGDVADVERGDQVGDGPAQGSAGCADGTEGPFVAVDRLLREGLQGSKRRCGG